MAIRGETVAAESDETAERIAREAEARDVRNRWWLSAPALAIITAASIGPLLIVVLYSFLKPGDYGNVKWELSTDAWTSVLMQRDIFDDTLQWADAHLSIFWRSATLSLWTTFLTLVFGVPTAYFIATRPERSRNLWLFLITIPFWSNLLIRTIAVMELLRAEGAINNVLVGLHIVEAPIQMMFTDFAIAFGMTYVFLPLMVLPVYASIEKVDFRLVEAGYDLYANRWQVFRRVTLPLIKPGIIAGSILVFIPSLGAYVTPRVLGGGKNLMIGNLIELQFGQGRNWPLGAALSLTLMAIVLVALMYYVRVAGGQKGGQGHA